MAAFLALLGDPRAYFVADVSEVSSITAPGGFGPSATPLRRLPGDLAADAVEARITTAARVSSMITSTPVSFSSARCWRPSRPMIGPSSFRWAARPGGWSTRSCASRIAVQSHLQDASAPGALPHVCLFRRSAAKAKPAWCRASCSTPDQDLLRLRALRLASAPFPALTRLALDSSTSLNQVRSRVLERWKAAPTVSALDRQRLLSRRARSSSRAISSRRARSLSV